MTIEKSEQSAERNRRDYRLGKSGHRVQRFLKKSAGEPDKIHRRMTFAIKAPDISHTGDQQPLKSMADPIIGNALKITFQLVRYAKLFPPEEC